MAQGYSKSKAEVITLRISALIHNQRRPFGVAFDYVMSESDCGLMVIANLRSRCGNLIIYNLQGCMFMLNGSRETATGVAPSQ